MRVTVACFAPALALAMVVAVPLSACSGESPVRTVAGDREHGRLALRQYGCGSCHRIPGVAAADGEGGPSLAGIARRVYLAGIVPNEPDHMVRWIRGPREIDPGTTMPDLQVPESHARDMAAYLYTLR